MSKEEIKQALGEYYINPTEKTKDVYIDIINRFINKHPKFKPIVEDYHYRTYFNTYCKNNELHILEEYYFLQNIPYSIRGGNNDICIVVDKNGVKRVILKRGMYAEPKEMARSLAISTLKDLYKCLVYDIIDHIKIYREIKDIQSKVANFNENTIIKQIWSNNDVTFNFIKKIEFSKKNKTLVYATNYITVNPTTNIIKKNFSDNGNTQSINNRKIIYSFLDEKNIVKEEEVKEFVEDAYNKKIAKIYLEKENVLSSF